MDHKGTSIKFDLLIIVLFFRWRIIQPTGRTFIQMHTVACQLCSMTDGIASSLIASHTPLKNCRRRIYDEENENAAVHEID